MCSNTTKKLYRSQTEKIIFGVCGGLGKYFEVDPVLVRILFVLAVFWGGFGILLYLILALIIPLEPAITDEVKTTEEKELVKEVKEKVKLFAEEIKQEVSDEKWYQNKRTLVGIVILITGLLFLIQNITNFHFLRWDVVWPIILVLIGLFLLFKK